MMANELSVSIYDGMDGAARAVAQEAAAQITGLQRRVVADIGEIGTILLRVKEAIDHGQFLPWLKAEFGWTERTAQNYMSVAERLGEKYETVSHLPLRTIYALASPSTPDEVRTEIVAKLERDDPVALSNIDAEISEARRAAARKREEEKRLAKKSPEARAKAQAQRERRAAYGRAEAERYQELRQKREEDRQAAADLIASSISEADLERLCELLKDGSVGRVDLIAAGYRLREQG